MDSGILDREKFPAYHEYSLAATLTIAPLTAEAKERWTRLASVSSTLSYDLSDWCRRLVWCLLHRKQSVSGKFAALCQY